MIGASFGNFASSGGGATPFSFGNALQFDGVDDYVVFAPIDVQSNSTISFWFKSVNTDSGSFIGKLDSAAVSVRHTTTTNMRFALNGYNDFTVPRMRLNEWHHVMFSLGATDMRCFVDGEESSSRAQPNRVGDIDILGIFRNVGSGFAFEGVMDELAITTSYEADLSDAQSLYNSGNGAEATAILGDLDLYYHLDETSPASTATDSSGNGNDGQLNNFDTSTCWVEH